MQVNAIITSTAPNGKKLNTTISYLRPSQKSKAVLLGQTLSQLTNNTYLSTQVNEIDVLSSSKDTPTLTIGTWSQGSGAIGTYYYAQVTYSGDGDLFVKCSQPAVLKTYSASNIVLEVYTSSSFTGQLYSTETDTYNAVTLNFSST